jgi:hypothetical protein
MSGQRRYSDDEFDRALRELAEGTAGEPRFREASAAERARQAKQQAKRARKQSRRRRGRGQPERDSRGRATTWTSVSVVLVLVAAGAFIWLQVRPPSTGTTAAPIAPAVAPVAPAADAAPPADPFTGTPANTWANGAAGIVVPAAKPVGNFTAAQVEAAYQTTRKLLIAADLNKPTLLGGAPTAFADLLTSEQRAQFLGGLNKMGTNQGGYPLSTRRWVMSFAPGSTQLIGSVVKVQGTMSAKSVSDSGTTALAITVNYLFTYAIEPPGVPTDWMRLLAHQYGSFDFAQWNDPGGRLEPWDQTIIGHAGLRCGSTDGYLHPDYPSERASGAGGTQSGPALNPYSNATDVPGGGAVCGNLSTGT